MEEMISFDQISKSYNSIIGKLSALKQKKYNLLTDLLKKSSEMRIIEINETIDYETIKEDILKKIDEIETEITEQLLLLREIEENCRKKIVEYNETIDNYNELNKYIKEYESNDTEIKKYNKILAEREIPILLDEEKRVLKEYVKRKEEALEKIGMIIPINPENKIDYLNNQKEILLEIINSKRKEMVNYYTIYPKVKYKLEEKTDDELVIKDTLKMIKRKKFIKELKKNMKQQEDSFGSEPTEILSIEEIKKEENKRLTPKKTQEMLTVLDRIMREKQANDNKNESTVQEIINNSDTKLDSTAQLKILKIAKESIDEIKNDKENKTMESENIILSDDKQDENKKLTPEKAQEMLASLDKIIRDKQENVNSNSTIEQEINNNSNNKTQLKKLKLVRNEQKSSNQTKSKKIDLIKQPLNRIHEEGKNTEVISSINENLQQKEQTNNYSEGLRLFMKDISGKSDNNHQERIEQEIGDSSFVNSMIEKEIPIESKVLRQEPMQKTKTIYERIKERIYSYLYDSKEINNNRKR